jgi:hypothetical protein
MNRADLRERLRRATDWALPQPMVAVDFRRTFFHRTKVTKADW